MHLLNLVFKVRLDAFSKDKPLAILLLQNGLHVFLFLSASRVQLLSLVIGNICKLNLLLFKAFIILGHLYTGLGCALWELAIRDTNVLSRLWRLANHPCIWIGLPHLDLLYIAHKSFLIELLLL